METDIEQLGALLLIGLLVLAAWSIVWKGFALWYAARLNQKGWFWVMMIVNTVGILEIIYIFAVAKRKKELK